MNLRERREFAAGLDTDELWLYILSLLFELARSIGPPHPRESLEYHSDDDAENPQMEGSASAGISQQGSGSPNPGWSTLDVTGGLLRLQDQAALAIGVTVTLFYWGEPGSTVVIDH